MSIFVGGLFLAESYSADANTILYGMVAAMALACGWASGAFRVHRIAGPVRLPEDAPVLPFASVFFGGLGCFIVAANLIAHLLTVPTVPGSDGTQASSLSTSAYIACIPPIIGLTAVWVGDRAILPMAGQKLGLSARLVPSGIGTGLLASLIVIPILFFASGVVEFIYTLVSYQHEQEHPMLRAMGDTPSPLVRISLVVGACVIVPIWEETLFRGHLQTLLTAAFGRLLSSPAPQLPVPSILPNLTDTVDSHVLQSVAVPRKVLRYRKVASWLGVLLTSAIFALLHPTWSAPVIFLLAVGLGYAYERTGNLWVSIAMHAAFNSISTFWYLIHSLSS